MCFFVVGGEWLPTLGRHWCVGSLLFRGRKRVSRIRDASRGLQMEWEQMDCRWLHSFLH